jgi:hypothetical protein
MKGSFPKYEILDIEKEAMLTMVCSLLERASVLY